MKDNEYGYSDNYNVSWRNVDSVRIDTQRIKAEQPEIYAQYARKTHCRRFEIKEAANNGNRIDKTA